MISAFQNINLLAVLAAFVASFVLGGVYFVVIVAKIYPIAMGRENMPPLKPTPVQMFGPAVCNLFFIVTSAVLLRMLQITELPDALAFGLLIGIGYILSTVMNIAINPNIPRPFLYTAINAPYFLITSLMTSAILVWMN